MKTAGILGGMSWESTTTYYQLINRGIARELGGLHSARLLLHSVDFAPIEKLQHEDRWEECGEILADAARSLERGGADFLVLATNTMHRVAEAIEAATSLDLLHIADATGEALVEAGHTTVALLGTRFTMEQDFYRGRLEARFGLRVLTPDQPGCATVHRIICDELCRGRILEGSRDAYTRIIEELAQDGAGAVILGCTEIGLLVKPEYAPIPVFDTTEVHAAATVARMLA